MLPSLGMFVYLFSALSSCWICYAPLIGYVCVSVFCFILLLDLLCRVPFIFIIFVSRRFCLCPSQPNCPQIDTRDLLPTVAVKASAKFVEAFLDDMG